MKIQTTRTGDDFMDEDWRSRFLPSDEEEVELPPEGFEPNIGDSMGDGLPDPFESDDDNTQEPSDEVAEPDEDPDGTEFWLRRKGLHIDDVDPLTLELSKIAENQQRIMMAIDQMSSGFSNQLVILARRIDNFERVLDQSIGQPTMTNLMFDAPEVFNKVVNREDDSIPRRDRDEEGKEPEIRATEPRTPVEGFEIPDEVEHLLNYSADFPVSVEIQAAFYMWKQKLSSFQDFVKVAGGPVNAKKARSHLE